MILKTWYNLKIKMCWQRYYIIYYVKIEEILLSLRIENREKVFNKNLLLNLIPKLKCSFICAGLKFISWIDTSHICTIIGRFTKHLFCKRNTLFYFTNLYNYCQLYYLYLLWMELISTNTSIKNTFKISDKIFNNVKIYLLFNNSIWG